MSSSSTPTTSPGSIQPLHNPKHAAQVVVPQAPLGNTTNGPLNQAPGMGAKAMLAKRMAKSQNPTFVSPTDNMVTPVTKRLGAAKQKHFAKGANPMQPLFSQAEATTEDSDEETTPAARPSEETMATDDNPF
ncbi:hypothetical protein EVG20_g89 [Dentipellis fragilis]|uniref:Uncharacterized protein n=1 Tax=Dentipellis fragilis TaxID=205917 RepID=A0A4Y9ZG75_9AGAM|nr:hypothetical protein EVG20_g89 [Dentipellis fragilis]